MSQPPKWHLDRFARLVVFTQVSSVLKTQTQTTLRATSVATGRIASHAQRAGDAA